MSRPVVIGFDGSAPSLSALDWAAEEAQLRGTSLHVLTVAAPSDGDSDAAKASAWARARRARAGELAGQGVLHARMRYPDLDVTGVVLEGCVKTTLIERAFDAGLVVTGARWRPELPATVLGSVEGVIAARAPVPTVVVPTRADPVQDGAVIAGVDFDGAGSAVLGFACAHAARRKLPVRAVLVWHPDGSRGDQRRIADPPVHAVRWLDKCVDEWRDAYPDADIDACVVGGPVATGLVAAAAEQHLLVLGRHGAYARPDAFLGSVSQALLHRVSCPVAIVPAPPMS